MIDSNTALSYARQSGYDDANSVMDKRYDMKNRDEVIANEYYERTASINGENLSIQGNLSEFSDGGVDTIGYELQNMAVSAEKIVKEYPDRFHQLDFKLFDFSGNKIVGIMRIFGHFLEIE